MRPVFRRLFGLTAPLDTGGALGREKWVIEPSRTGLLVRFEELWRHRRILWFFSVREVKDRYEGMTLGIFWLFARPLLPIFVTAFVFGGLLQVPSDGVPYFLFFLAGVSCWRVFERSVLWVTKSLESNRTLLKKVYFPRLLAPISSVAPAVTEFVVMLTLLLLVVGYYFFHDGMFYLRLGFPMLVALLAIVLTVFFAVSIGLWTSVVQVRHKETRFGLRYLMQFWLYATPVIYPLSSVPDQYRFVVYLNPMAPLVEAYKWGMLGIGEFPGAALLSGVAVIFVTFAAGLVFFDRSEAVAVDQL